MDEEIVRMRLIANRLLDETPMAFRRSLGKRIDWGNRLICLKVDGEFVFEVGGRKKRFTQIKDMPQSYVVADDLECGTGNRIPLWLFGFMY